MSGTPGSRPGDVPALEEPLVESDKSAHPDDPPQPDQERAREELLRDAGVERDVEVGVPEFPPVEADFPLPAPEPPPAPPAPFSSQLERVMARAAAEIGYREGPRNDNKFGLWYGMNHEPWCAMFLSWAFFLEALSLPAQTTKGFHRTLEGARWFQRNDRWTDRPARGHLVFYDLGTEVPGIDHVGFVARVNDDGSIQAVEGNTSPDGSRDGVGVFARNRRRGIVGYGIPEYQDTRKEVEEMAYVMVEPGGEAQIPLMPGRNRIRLACDFGDTTVRVALGSSMRWESIEEFIVASGLPATREVTGPDYMASITNRGPRPVGVLTTTV